MMRSALLRILIKILPCNLLFGFKPLLEDLVILAVFSQFRQGCVNLIQKLVIAFFTPIRIVPR